MTAVDVDALAALARLAGRRILDVYAQAGGVTATAKADDSPVTAADMAAHQAIVEGLARLTPGVPIVSEEDVPADAARTVGTAPRCWLVDPLDGTRDFLARTGHFTVNIALMEAGVPVLGLVLAPAADRLWLAQRGLGAWLQDAGGLRRVVCRAAPRPAFVALVSGMHGRGEGPLLRQAFPQASVQAVGSSLKYALIASGEADLTVRYSPTSLWDTAAAQCILEAAGGAMVDFSGRPLVYNHGGLTNPPFVAVGDPGADVAAILAALAALGAVRSGGDDAR